MKIVIITRGRVGKIRTAEWIPQAWWPNTVILCPADEVERHQHNHPELTVVSEGGTTLNYSQKFNDIVNGHFPELGRRILIMDDDLRFSMREGSGKLGIATPYAVDHGFECLKAMLEDYPLVGLHPRAMGNNAPYGVKECTRINAMQGVNLDLIGGMKLDYWPILADMVLNLSLLTRGQKTAIWCDLFWDTYNGSNAEGGCSLHRTWQQQSDAVHGLAEMFPLFVKVKEKETKAGWWPGKPRVDFVIQWQQAYKWGVKNANSGKA